MMLKNREFVVLQYADLGIGTANKAYYHIRKKGFRLFIYTPMMLLSFLTRMDHCSRVHQVTYDLRALPLGAQPSTMGTLTVYLFD